MNQLVNYMEYKRFLKHFTREVPIGFQDFVRIEGSLGDRDGFWTLTDDEEKQIEQQNS